MAYMKGNPEPIRIGPGVEAPPERKTLPPVYFGLLCRGHGLSWQERFMMPPLAVADPLPKDFPADYPEIWGGRRST